MLSVLAGGAADRAGIRAGDVFHAFDGIAVSSATEFGALLDRHVAGDRVRIELLRQRRPISATVVLSPRKLESVGFADVLYRSVIAGGSRRRTIVTRPRTPGRHPAVLFIGGLGCSWMEYTLENVRRQRALAGAPLDEVDVAVRDAEVCAHHFFVQQEQPEQVEAIGPACARMLRGFGNVPYTYMQQVGDISLARQWKQVDIPVLVIYGTSDALTSADESRYLVELINSFHPGRAMYQEVPGMAHGFTVYSSQKEFMTDKKPHPTDRKVLDLILGWAEEHAGRPP